MAQIAKFEFKFDIKSSAEGFYKFFKCKPYLFPKLCPNLVKECQQVEGDWGSAGSVRKWIYVSGNSSEFHTEKIEAIDEKNKSITCKMLDGGFTKLYRSYKYTIQAIDKDEGAGSTVKSTIEYEKQNDDVQPPNMYADMAFVIYKDIDAHLIKN